MLFNTERRSLTPRQMRALRFVWANCLLHSERCDEAIAVFGELSRQGDLRATEGLLDAYVGKMHRIPPGARRNRFVRKIRGTFLWSVSHLLRRPTGAYFLDRFVWKLACFFEREDPDALPILFDTLDATSYWDRDGRHGSDYRDRTAALRE
ncbi:MAG: hypothetical protein ACYTAF_15315 [Planctomycetota bacterium]|jgi:hypothetical protein